MRFRYLIHSLLIVTLILAAILVGTAPVSSGTSVDKARLPKRLIVSMDATQALAAMERGVLTSSRYVDVLIARIERHPELNAFIYLDAQQALAAAAEADQLRASGEIKGPLHGLPILIKDNIDTANMPTTAGTRSLEYNSPADNAVVVQALIDAGAIVLGKTNMHELALGITSNNAFFGPVRNPYDLDRIPGGSSGGNGAGLAARFAPVALGTDTGGSIRIPAALTGTMGFRPSPGRYPRDGIVPLSSTLDTAGPMARTVDDLTLLDSVIAGGPSELERVRLRGLRIGVPRAHFRENLHPEVERAMDRVLRRLKRAGVTLVEADIPYVPDLSVPALSVLIGCEFGPEMTRYLDEHGLNLTVFDVIAMIASPDVAALFTQPLPPPELCAQFTEDVVPLLRATYQLYLATNDLDAVLYPSTPLPAAPIEQDFEVELNDQLVPTQATYTSYTSNTHFAPVVGAPALSLPMGQTDDGLPMGIELAGAPGSDRQLLAIGKAVAKLLPRVRPPSAE